jgi:hypothetical protein
MNTYDADEAFASVRLFIKFAYEIIVEFFEHVELDPLFEFYLVFAAAGLFELPFCYISLGKY